MQKELQELINIRKKDFFTIKERLQELEKYLNLKKFENRIEEIDLLMEDMLELAKKYGEEVLEAKVIEYNKDPSKECFVWACFVFANLFRKESWDLGILEKYLDYAIYGGEEGKKRYKLIEAYCYDMIENKGKTVYDVMKELKKRGLVNCTIL